MSMSTRRRTTLVAAGVALAGLGALTAAGMVQAIGHTPRPKVPSSGEVETKAGIRVTRLSVAADGGLLDLRYVVLNPNLAQAWTGDTNHPPVLGNERSGTRFDRVAAMRDGHDLRPGQTYYLVYLNQGGEVHPGDHVDVTVAGVTLKGVPVE